MNEYFYKAQYRKWESAVLKLELVLCLCKLPPKMEH